MSRAVAVRSKPMLAWLCTISATGAEVGSTRKPGSSRRNGSCARRLRPAEVTTATRAWARGTDSGLTGAVSCSATACASRTARCFAGNLSRSGMDTSRGLRARPGPTSRTPTGSTLTQRCSRRSWSAGASTRPVPVGATLTESADPRPARRRWRPGSRYSARVVAHGLPRHSRHRPPGSESSEGADVSGAVRGRQHDAGPLPAHHHGDTAPRRDRERPQRSRATRNGWPRVSRPSGCGPATR